FGAAESVISSLLMAIPAVKGVSFCEGFGFAGLRGSEANDAYVLKDGKISTATNHNGGILGGITNGSPVIFEVVVKPTASISKPQQTVNLKTMEEETITVKGRHDACIVPRAAVAIAAAAYIAALDLMMERGW
ncbi:MAG: chorismate synthase, partial [Christensenellaceae bacterium]|nr:chorismate synthase [Christensenellaceae bacterium]